ncbi:MAG: type II toxin-antitoxin system Phd/YefM family antitoxin [Gaiellaceae bacterium]
MRTIGVRELKATLSEALRQVERGERIRVTSRGRVVADIVPAGSGASDDPLAELIAQGRVTPASMPVPREPPPLVRGRGSATEYILAEREADR